jgi:phosphoserine phosphatase RsbU/P
MTYAHLLLVSDDQERLQAVAGPLAQIGLYEVVLTSSLEQAMHLMASGQAFDMVLVDVGIEKCAGEHFLQNLAGEVPVPVIAIGAVQELAQITHCIEMGATDYVLLPVNSTLLKARIQSHLQKKRLQEQAITALHSFNEVEKLADDLRLVILPLGVALSAEKDFDRLVERFVITAMDLCQADAGTLFMRTAEDELRYAIARVKSLGLAYGGTTGEPVPYGNLLSSMKWGSRYWIMWLLLPRTRLFQ